jgi:hypothetical protein
MYTDITMSFPEEKFHVDFGTRSIRIAEYDFGPGLTLLASPEQLLKLADEIYKKHGGVKNERAAAS